MITAEEANQKCIELRAEQEKRFAELKLKADLIKQGKLIPQSNLTINDVETRIDYNISAGKYEFINELSQDIIGKLKQLGYRVYLCKKIEKYASWNTNSGGKLIRTIDTCPNYVTAVVWNNSCFRENDYDEVKEY